MGYLCLLYLWQLVSVFWSKIAGAAEDQQDAVKTPGTL